MMKQEFESRVERSVTKEEYEIIDFVYTYHPAISNVTGKDQIADLYRQFGMVVIKDMLPTAAKAQELEDEIRVEKSKLATLEEEYRKLKEGR